MLVRHEDGSARLLVLGLGAHVIAIGVLLGSVLCSSSEAEAPAPRTPAPPVPAAPQKAARATQELVPAHPPAHGEAPARTALATLSVRDQEQARSITTTLALVLLDPAAEDDLWADSVASYARTLERAHEPALEALLADASLTVEEHIAASELLEALRTR